MQAVWNRVAGHGLVRMANGDLSEGTGVPGEFYKWFQNLLPLGTNADR